MARYGELFVDLAHVVLGWPSQESPRRVDCRRFGAVFRLCLRDWGDRCVFLGCDEPLAHDWLRTKLRAGDLFVDVGANIGAYSVFAAARGARVIAFEPQPEPAERLQESLALNPGAGELALHRIGLSDRPGQMEMYAFGDGSASGNTSFHRFPEGAASGVVAVETLDNILASEEQSIRAIKIDVEGHEVAVLNGALTTLERLTPDYLIVEVADEHLTRAGTSAKELLKLLSARGYRAVGYARPYDGVQGRPRDLRHLPPVETSLSGIATVMFERADRDAGRSDQP